MYYLFLFQNNNGYANAPGCYVKRTLSVSLLRATVAWALSGYLALYPDISRALYHSNKKWYIYKLCCQHCTVRSESRCRCRKWCQRTIMSKNWIKQLHTLPVLHFNHCLTTIYGEITAYFNGNFDTDNQIYVPYPKYRVCVFKIDIRLCWTMIFNSYFLQPDMMQT
jgi:hypothetical protein